jgi:hypothetical protein
MIAITEMDHDHVFENIAAASAADETAKAEFLLSFLRSLPPPPPPATPPPPPPSLKMMKHSRASNGSLDSLETATTSSTTSTSSTFGDDDILEDTSARLDDDNDVENSKEKQQERRAARKLSWGNVQIREYNRIIGDHPEVSVGPPLSLDWQYHQHDDMGVDTYEESKASSRKQRRLLRLSSLTRRNLLANEFQIPVEDLQQAEVQVQKMQRQRVQSQRRASLRNKLKSFRRGLIVFLSNDREVLFAALSAASGGPHSLTGMSNSMSSSRSM